jgi:hypothetical protein
VIVSPVRAAVTGNQLIEWCAASNNFDQGYCLGYLRGIAEARSVLGGFCPPPGVILKQLVDVVVHYLNDNPAQRDTDAIWLVTTALSTAWPCR